ncbi:MAG TPA: carboxypeptidase regulatory-like domain-containing protein [Gemmatimonadaceae bacterium]|jgi:hypothetical protein|nr:carboxypeptidase regulatory-like domain-containing protein [Gemmatimonadaceae bacterium]
MLSRGCVVVVVAALAACAGVRRVAAQSGAVAVSGTAYDSLNRAPLAGALVTIVGTALTSRADSRGRFRFDSVPPGTHRFAAQHARLDTLGFSGISARATIGAEPGLVTITLPSFSTLWRAACGDRRAPNDSGFVYGNVRDATTGAVVPNAVVHITWIDLGVTRTKRVTETRWRGQSTTNETGDFAVCGIPADAGLRVVAATDSAVSGVIDVPARGARVQRRDLLLGPIQRDSVAPTGGTILGVVMDSGGVPVPDARVVADGVAELRTDSAGRFTARGVPVGSRQVEVLAIGRSPVVTVVDVTPTDTATVFATMRRITTLDVVRVTAPAFVRRLVRDLDERRKLGAGYVHDSTEVGRHGTLFSAFFSIPSVRPERMNSSEFYLSLPANTGRCVANLVIDGRRAGYDELTFLRPADVAAVEVYPRRMTAPMQYIRDDNCGAVAVWTKRAFSW